MEKKQKPPQKTRRVSRYSPAMGDRIISAIRELGSTRAVIDALGIPSGTYYTWLQQNPELHVRAEVAKVEYRRFQDEANIAMAKNWLIKLLKEGDVTIKKTIRQVVIREQVVEIKETSRVERPCPNWVIDRVLGTGSELNAVQVLVGSGFIPDGVSAQVMEAIDRAGDEIREAFEQGEPSYDDE